MRVLVYNIQMALPIYLSNGQHQRAAEIAEKIKNEANPFDVVVLIEAFYHSATKIILHEIRHMYQFQQDIPYKFWSRQCANGGVIILSRNPIRKSGCKRYKAAAGADQFAAKGWAWAQIHDPLEGLVWVVATHTQAWTIHDEIRKQQFGELYKWVHGNIPEDSRLLICGDMNFDYHTEREKLLEGIGEPFIVPELHSESRMFSVDDGHLNILRGMDGTAEEGGVSEAYFRRVCWSSGKENPGLCAWTSRKPEKTDGVPFYGSKLLDYGITLESRKHPSDFSIRVLDTWKAREDMTFDMWKIGWISRPSVTTRDLSDHYPVELELSWL